MRRSRQAGKRRVAIIHPWMPQYRKEFFELLGELARNADIDLHVYYGTTPPEWSSRNDTLLSNDYIELPTKHFKLGGRTFSLKDIRQYRKNGPYDLTVLEQAIRNLESYRILLTSPNKRSVAFWGHGRNYTVQRSQLEERFKGFLTRRGGWFFGYTEGGVAAVVQEGFPQQSTTVVYNSIDTRQLARDMVSVSVAELDELRYRLGARGSVGLYLGGVDSAKRVDFLIASAEKICEQSPDFTLVVAGDGDQRAEFEAQTQANDRIVFVGSVFDREKAKYLKLADLLLIPGRVGLIAVDSAASGVPIVTTDWPYHAPEFEYLTNGQDCLVSNNTEEAYVATVADVLKSPARREELSQNCLTLAEDLSTDRMASQFMKGILGALSLPR